MAQADRREAAIMSNRFHLAVNLSQDLLTEVSLEKMSMTA
jgi:hypothetical protein